MAKYEQSVIREIVDRETGEILTAETSKVFTKKITDDNFYMTFIDYVSPYFKLPPNAMKVLTWMCKNAEFNTGKVTLASKTRDQLAKDTGISPTTITSNLSTLKKAKLISGERGEFIINPQIFWKGELRARREILKDANLKITFSIE